MRLIILLLFISTNSFAQLSISDAKIAGEKFNIHNYTYHQKFEGHKEYAAPVYLTKDSGAIFYGDTNSIIKIYKLDKESTLEWKVPVVLKYDEIETQSVIQDKDSNYYAFVLVFNRDKIKGSTQRVIHFDKNGDIIWDKMLADFTKKNNPHCSYIRLLDNNKLELRGHIVLDSELENKEFDYHYWRGWLDNKGNLQHEVTEVIKWSSDKWKAFLNIE